MKYKIVEGLPHQVETDVQHLLDQGWVLHGDLMSRRSDGYDLVVQGMYLDVEPEVEAPEQTPNSSNSLVDLVQRVMQESKS